MRRLLTVSFALATLAPFGCRDIAVSRFRKHVTDKPAPDFELAVLEEDLDEEGEKIGRITDQKVKLASFRGKKVVCLFMSSYT